MICIPKQETKYKNHGRAEAPYSKNAKSGASTNFRQFEATPEARKLPKIYLEKLASSNARSTESKHHIWLSKTRILLYVAPLITQARSHSIKAIALAPI